MRSVRVEVATRAQSELCDITQRVQDAVAKAGVRDGAVLVFSQHTTAAVTLQENADPDVRRDLVQALGLTAPEAPPGGAWRHGEGNTPAHVKTALVGPSLVVPIEDGELQLGTWQGIYLCEFDGPRARHVLLRFLADAA